MLKKMREFDLDYWLMCQRAKWYTMMADRAIRRYKKKVSLR